MTLKIFSNGFDTCIAKSPEQARRCALAAVGESPDDASLSRIGDWRESGATEISVIDRATGVTTTRTAAEWIALSGPGFLCSTEY